MKRSKKNSVNKNNSNLNRTIVFAAVIVLISVGFLVIKGLFTDSYLNGYGGSRCGRGSYFKQFLWWTWCDKCDKGSYCPGDDLRYVCPHPDTTTRGQGAESLTECNHCKQEGTWFNGAYCEECPVGYYCSNGWKNACPNGQTTKTTGARSYTECYEAGCLPGEYVENGVCAKCPKNHYCDGKNISACGNNRETKYSGAMDSSACQCIDGYYDSGYFCIICPIGSYCRGGEQIKCSNGQTTRSMGATNRMECINVK